MKKLLGNWVAGCAVVALVASGLLGARPVVAAPIEGIEGSCSVAGLDAQNRLALAPGDSWGLSITFGNGSNLDTLFTASMLENDFYGPTHTVVTESIDGGGNIGVSKQVHLTTDPSDSGSDTVSVFVTSDRTGSTILGQCSFELVFHADTDGDGIYDLWETEGYDTDGDGEPDLNLAEIGASPLHKDIFVELDWMGDEAFTHAPNRWEERRSASTCDDGIDNGGNGLVDLADPTCEGDTWRFEEGVQGFTCDDGIDNGGDGFTDVQDPSCLVRVAPTRAVVQAVKDAFANAPASAGTLADRIEGGVPAVSNPDGQPGINLWIDTGDLTDATASEDGGVPGTCGDGQDNGADGSTDADDPDCLVGDDIGGGNSVGSTTVLGLDDAFYDVKRANFDNPPAFFRYVLHAAPGFEDGSSEPTSCIDSVDQGSDGADRKDGDEDCKLPKGGQGERGGNDAVSLNLSAGTLMHEIGHNLNLHHGGKEALNCKPNYRSIMNYAYGLIPTVAGPMVLDFSPVALSSGTRIGIDNKLDESNLNESSILNPSDNEYLVAVAPDLSDPPDGTPDDNDGNGTRETFPADGPIDWNDDDDVDDGPGLEANQNVHATKCKDSELSELNSWDDWSTISLPFRQFGDSADGALDPSVEEWFDEEEYLADLTNTDLAVDVDLPTTVFAGETATANVAVTNNGPAGTPDAQVLVVIPDGIDVEIAPDRCTDIGSGDYSCSLGATAVGAETNLTFDLSVAADAVFANGGPIDVEMSAQVNSIISDEIDPTDNVDTQEAIILAKADLSIFDASVSGGGFVVVAEPARFDVQAAASNAGPSSPMDATVDVAASHPFATTSPERPLSLRALAVGTDQGVQGEVVVTCDDAGTGDLQVGLEITPRSILDTDPNAANNAASAMQEVECLLPVAINVRPGQFPNRMNAGGGSLEVGILTTGVGEYGLPLPFDTRWVDSSSLRFASREDALGGWGSAPRRSPRSWDVKELLDERTRDGDDDLRAYFTASDTGLAPGAVEACVVGSFERPDRSGGRFIGCDSVVVLP